MLAEVTAPVLLLNGQLDQLRVDARRFARAARSARWVRVVTVRGGLHVFPLTHPQRDGGRAVGAAHRSAARSGSTVTAPPTGGTRAMASVHSGSTSTKRSPGVGGPGQA